jgi:LacI family transcriptional regulator
VVRSASKSSINQHYHDTAQARRSTRSAHATRAHAGVFGAHRLHTGRPYTNIRTVTTRDGRRPVQLRDVAAAAGVSISTASRVLTGSGRCSPAAREAVEAAANRLSYEPNKIARALRAQSTRSIGMIVPWLRNPFYAELVEAVDVFLQRVGLDLVLADARGLWQDEARRVHALVSRRVDGLIVVPTDEHESTRALAEANQLIPVVQLGYEAGVDADYVGIDNALGIHLVLDHLVELGANSVRFVSSTINSSAGKSRLQAFWQGTEERSLRRDEPILGRFTAKFGKEAVKQILAEGSMPDAIVCASDVVALGVIGQLRAEGISVPDHVMVTGFDDIMFAELCDPPLTTIHQPRRRLAEATVSALVARINGEHGGVPSRVELRPHLVVRRSSLAPPRVMPAASPA